MTLTIDGAFLMSVLQFLLVFVLIMGLLAGLGVVTDWCEAHIRPTLVRWAKHKFHWRKKQD